MLSIDRLHIRLPHAYRQHAKSITDRVGQLLAETDHRGLRNTDILDVPVVQVNEGAGAEDIAVGIANGIKSTMEAGR